MALIRSLCKCARNGDLPSLERLVNSFPALLGERNKDGRTPLIVAVRHSQADAVKLLLDRGASVDDSSSRSGATPVWHASWKGDLRTCAILLEHGCDPMREAQDCGT